MAWVKVYERVIGPKLRSLAKEVGCSQNEALGCLVRLWLWGISNADSSGRIVGGDEGDIVDVLSAGIDRQYTAESVVSAMKTTGWIDIDDNGIYLHDWDEWQSQWYKDANARRKDAERKRAARALQRSTTEATLDPHKSEPKKAAKKTVPIKKDYPEGFENFWSVYPKKVGKGEAYKKFCARVNDGWSEAELTEAASRYAECIERDKTDERYIKHPKTFLSETTPFTDYLRKDKPNLTVEANVDDPYAEWRSQ